MKGTLSQSLRLVGALLIGVGCKHGDESGKAADKASAASDATIKIGQTMPYSGPASAYGTIGKVETAFFQKLNKEGGIHGRHVDLISVDDGYNPAKAVEQVRRLVEQDHVLFIFHSVECGHPAVPQLEQGAATLRRERCDSLGGPRAFSVDDGL